MLKFLLSLSTCVSFCAFSQEQKPVITQLKTYSAEEWNKWYFDDWDLTTLETNKWDRWKMSVWGMEVMIETVTEGNYQSWKIGARGGVCSVVKKKKYNAWTLISEGKTFTITATAKDLSSWEMTGDASLKAHVFAPADWDHWVIEGNLVEVNYPEAVAAFLFVPVFSASVRPVHKLK